MSSVWSWVKETVLGRPSCKTLFDNLRENLKSTVLDLSIEYPAENEMHLVMMWLLESHPRPHISLPLESSVTVNECIDFLIKKDLMLPRNLWEFFQWKKSQPQGQYWRDDISRSMSTDTEDSDTISYELGELDDLIGQYYGNCPLTLLPAKLQYTRSGRVLVDLIANHQIVRKKNTLWESLPSDPEPAWFFQRPPDNYWIDFNKRFKGFFQKRDAVTNTGTSIQPHFSVAYETEISYDKCKYSEYIPNLDSGLTRRTMSYIVNGFALFNTTCMKPVDLYTSLDMRVVSLKCVLHYAILAYQPEDEDMNNEGQGGRPRRRTNTLLKQHFPSHYILNYLKAHYPAYALRQIDPPGPWNGKTWDERPNMGGFVDIELALFSGRTDKMRELNADWIENLTTTVSAFAAKTSAACKRLLSGYDAYMQNESEVSQLNIIDILKTHVCDCLETDDTNLQKYFVSEISELAEALTNKQLSMPLINNITWEVTPGGKSRKRKIKYDEIVGRRSRQKV